MIIITITLIVYLVSIIGLIVCDYIILNIDSDERLSLKEIIAISHPYTYIPLLNTFLLGTIVFEIIKALVIKPYKWILSLIKKD